jgi:non-homologous end joining protein Ku
MASATKKASSLTTLKIGAVEVPVGLFSTVASPSKLAQFDTAGPNGGVLKARAIARPVPVEETAVDVPDVPVASDPLADDPGPEDPGPEETFEERVRAALGDRDPESSPLFDKTHAPLQQVDGQYGRELVEEGSGLVVLPQNVRKGVRLEDGRFIDCTTQLEVIDDTTKLERMEVLYFIDGTHVPRVRVKGAYYVGAADEKAPRALRIIFEALKATRRMAVVKLTKKSRQTLGVIGNAGGVLVLLELVWSEDFREPPARATRIQKEQVTEQEVAMFSQLIEAMSAPPSVVDDLRDDAIALREELRVKAEAGEVAQIIMPAPATEAESLMASLEASLAAVSS